MGVAQRIGISAIIAIGATTAFAAFEVTAELSSQTSMTSPVHQCLVRVSPTLSHPALVKVSSTAVVASPRQLMTILPSDDLESAMPVRLKEETTTCSTLPYVTT